MYSVGKSVYIGYNAPFVWIVETRGTHCDSNILSQVKFGHRSGASPNPSLIRNSGKTSSAFGHVRLPITGDPHNRSFLRPSHSLSNALLQKKQEPYFLSPRVIGVFLTGFYRHSSYHHIITFLCINVSERGTSRLLVWSIALCECLYIYCLLYSWSLLILAPFYLI